MKALREVRPPGIYPVGFESRITPLSIAEAHIAGFVGLASKGPLDQPRHIQNWNDFVEIYGPTSEGYLARAVEGFFQNGGKSCYVVRVARRPAPGEALMPEHAAPAERVVRDVWDKPTLRVLALNEGRWGNAISVRFAHATGAQTLLALDVSVGATAARVTSTRGFERGALVRIYQDRDRADYVILTDVDDREKMLRWGTETPLLRSYAAPTKVEVVEFEVHATLRDQREVFKHLQLSPLSRRYAPREVSEKSRLIRLEDLLSPSSLPNHLPAPLPAERLTGGRDGTDEYMDGEGILQTRRWMTAEDFVGHDHGADECRGLYTLARVEDVGLLLVPDAQLAYSRLSGPEARNFVLRIYDVMADICENLQDRFAILDMPQTRDIEEVRKIRQNRESAYTAFYFPWLEVPTADGGTVKQPPSGHVAGIFARCDQQHGVHKAPANEPLLGVTQLTLPLSDDHIGQLNVEGVNSLRAFTGRGIRIWGARTTSRDPDWRYVNVRRLFVMLRRSLQNGTQWAAFEPNTPETWGLVTREITSFLSDLWNRGYFAGGQATDSFLVKCDRETNSAEVVDAGRMMVEIRIAPALPTEYILFTLEQLMNDPAPAQATG